MSNIAILSQQLTNMIAAGEVVERPLQVVKECVENSIDAGATNIEITLKTGGIEYIGIKDDGCGIAYDQLPLAFTRHATSKLTDVSQLFQIETMGFRGEALPSIASVALVTCDSNDGNGGGRYKIDNGDVITHQPIVCDKGTHIRIEHLFAKVPARLKHLKNDHYEQSLIVNTIQKLALINLHIAFTLIADDTIIFESDGKGSIENAMFAIYGKAVTQSLMHFKDSQFDISIDGVIAASQYSRSNKNQITLSLNGRYIRPNKLMAVILRAIKQYYPEGKYPILVLNVTMEYSLVDVNVHPSKLEVRISKENQLESMVFNALESTLRLNNTYIEYEPVIPVEQPIPVTSTFSTPAMVAKESINYMQQNEKVEVTTLDFDAFVPSDTQVSLKQTSPVNKPIIETVNQQESAFASTLTNQSPLTLIGQMHGKFILASDEKGLVIIDQHAAQERVHYEQIRTLMLSNKSKYPVLTPILIPISNGNEKTLALVNQKLASIGLTFESFGPNEWVLRLLPSWAKDIDDGQFYADLINDALLDKSVDLEEVLRDKIASKACKSSIKFNQYLDIYQQQQVINELFACCDPYACPHGRPIAIHISDKQLEKEFSR